MTSVVAAVIERGGRILIAQHKAGGWHPLKWEFPGGKVEPGETPEEAVTRELREELAIDVRAAREIVRYEYQYPDRSPILLIFYRVADFAGEPRNLQFERLTWEMPERLRDYDFLEGDSRFIDRYCSAAGVSGPAEV
jgi:8-oxo-dGTP diphosphatase